MSRFRNVKALAAAAKSKYGKGTVSMGSNIVKSTRIPTGCMAMDVALGGGLPVGKPTIFYGDQSSGKTTTATRIAGIAQKLCANCYRPIEAEVKSRIEDGEEEFYVDGQCSCYGEGLFKPVQYPGESKILFKERLKGYETNSFEEYRVAIVDAEGSIDPVWSETLGLDMRLVVYVRPDSAEEAMDIYDSLLRTGSVDMILLDSIAALTPSDEIQESKEKWQQGLQARLVNKFCRTSVSSVNSIYREYGRRITQVWINQTRQKIGVMFGDPTTLPGGKGQRFAASVEVKLWSSQYEVDAIAELPGKQKNINIAKRVRINFKVEKNKTAPPKGTGSYVMWLEDGSIDEFPMVVSLCEKYGIIAKNSATDWRFRKQKFKTKKALLLRLSRDKVLLRDTKADLVKRMIGGRNCAKI